MTGAVFACLLRLHEARLAGPSEAATEAPNGHAATGVHDTELTARSIVSDIESVSSTDMPQFLGVQVMLLSNLQLYRLSLSNPKYLKTKTSLAEGGWATVAQDFWGRVNIMHSPIEYASIYGEDPLPDLDHIFYVSGLASGTTLNDIGQLLDNANLGKARVTLKARGTQVRWQH